MQNLLFFFNTDYLGMLKHGVQAVLDDKGFQLPSPAVYEAYAAASEMLATHNDLANPLAQELVAQLSNCIQSKREKSIPRKEFHKVCLIMEKSDANCNWQNGNTNFLPICHRCDV